MLQMRQGLENIQEDKMPLEIMIRNMQRGSREDNIPLKKATACRKVVIKMIPVVLV
jgi:hypothetical protein